MQAKRVAVKTFKRTGVADAERICVARVLPDRQLPMRPRQAEMVSSRPAPVIGLFAFESVDARISGRRWGMVGHACPTPLGRGAGARLKALRAGFRVFFQERILSRGEAFRGCLSNVFDRP